MHTFGFWNVRFLQNGLSLSEKKRIISQKIPVLHFDLGFATFASVVFIAVSECDLKYWRVVDVTCCHFARSSVGSMMVEWDRKSHYCAQSAYKKDILCWLTSENGARCDWLCIEHKIASSIIAVLYSISVIEIAMSSFLSWLVHGLLLTVSTTGQTKESSTIYYRLTVENSQIEL